MLFRHEVSYRAAIDRTLVSLKNTFNNINERAAYVADTHQRAVLRAICFDGRVRVASIERLLSEADASVKDDSLVKKAFDVGDRLKDGTVVIAVDQNKNIVLSAPAAIFGGKATFDRQSEIPAQLNQLYAHGHKDWRNITDDEGNALAVAWEKVAPVDLKDQNSPSFWLSTPESEHFGRILVGGRAHGMKVPKYSSCFVPCVRSSPAI